jgi:hypothetical protein
MLVAHLEGICAKEGVTIEPEALALIARAAEGSVRDSLSLLDFKCPPIKFVIEVISAGNSTCFAVFPSSLTNASPTLSTSSLTRPYAGV